MFQMYLGNTIYLVIFLTVLSGLMEGVGIGLIIPLLESFNDTNSILANSHEVNVFDQIVSYIFNLFGIKKKIATLLIIIAFFFILKSFLNFLVLAYVAKMRGRLLFEIKKNSFEYFSTTSYDEYTKKNSGDMVNLLNIQPARALQAFQFCNAVLMSTVSSVIYFIMMILINIQFAILTIIGGIVLTFFLSLFNKYTLKISRMYTQESGILAKLFIQTITGFKYLLVTNRIVKLKPKIISSIKNISSYTSNMSIASAISSSFREPITVIFIFFIIYIQVEIFNFEMEIIFVFLLLLYKCMTSVSSILENYQQTLAHIGAIESIVNNTKQEVKNQISDNKIQKEVISKINSFIKLDKITYSYNRGKKKLFKNLSLEIPSNQIVAIAGDTGSGKTTLINILTGIIQAEKGSVFVDNKNLKSLDDTSWRKMIGYVSQNEFIFDDTIANNISFWEGDWKKDKKLHDKLIEVLKKVGLFDLVKLMPDGLDAMIGDRGNFLSQGQKQRIFIAREIFKRPELLIFDEATSALDHNSENIISETIKKIKGSLTIVIIAHTIKLIKNADIVYILKDGKIIEQGPYTDLIKKNQSYLSKMLIN